MVVETRSRKRKLKPDPTSCAKKESSDPSAQFSSEVDNRTAKELLARQQLGHDKFIQDYRTTAAQERSLVAETTSLLLEVEDLKKQLKSEKTQHKDLKANYDNLARNSDDQKKELQNEITRSKEYHKERNQILELLNGGSLADPNSTDDDEVRGTWIYIAFNVKQLAYQLVGASSGQPLDDEVTQRLQRVSKEYRKQMQDPDFRDLLMRGYIWLLVQDIEFDSKKDLWGGPGVRVLKMTHDNLVARVEKTGGDLDAEPPVAHIAGWLAKGSAIMNKLCEKDSIGINHVVDVETERLRPFMVDQKPGYDRTDKMVSKQLKDIIDSAIKLDVIMMSSRAIFHIHWGGRAQESGNLERWNPDLMEAEGWDHEVSPESRVQFRISPTLYKFGTVNGILYNLNIVLAKSAVVCD
ncbi:hypothetical protein HYE67_008345 [Fusarium culmorum]|uniref:Uncharacterized protein n=1 Tax=Fusarium culmorum TaxID=5516 RepID=A0A7S8HZE6_FUSCU|nr:hypothetical protein HYE67_008345 [Fusarium culmorum]